MFSSTKNQEVKPYFEGFETLFLLLTTSILLYKKDKKKCIFRAKSGILHLQDQTIP